MTASVPIVPLCRAITAPTATMCHARYLARKAAKQQMQAAGLKVSHIEARIIHAQANAYQFANSSHFIWSNFPAKSGATHGSPPIVKRTVGLGAC